MTAPQYWFDPLLDQTTWGDHEFSPGAWFDTETLGVISGEGSISISVQVARIYQYTRLAPYGATGRFPSGLQTLLGADGLIDSVVTVLGVGEGIAIVVPPSTVQPSGGWGWSGGFDHSYERELRRRAEIRREQQQLEAETESIKEAVDREIAQLLRRQEAEDQKRSELERLRAIADTLSAREVERDYGSRVAVALTRAIDQGSFSALAALDRELQRAREEEEQVLLAVTMIIAED